MKKLKTLKFTKRELLIFVAGVAVLGTALTLYSRAATEYSLQSSLEAESTEPIARMGNIFSDSKASGGKATVLYTNGVIKTPVFTTTDTTLKIDLVARGQLCRGAPKAQIKVDNVDQGTVSVSSTAWATYELTVKVPAGRHEASINFSNDYARSSRCDRNLYVDKMSFYAATPLPGDTTAPTVAISAPANGATVSGTMNVTASASDNVSVSKVEFYLDGQLVSTSLAAPYGFSKNTTELAAGSHTIEAKAYDPSGNVGTSKISVTNGSVSPPPVSTSGLNKGYFLNATSFVNAITNPVIRTDSDAFMAQFKAGGYWNPNFSIGAYGVAIVKGTGEFTAFPAPPPTEGYQYLGKAGKFPVPKVPAGTKPVSGTDGHLAVIVGTTVYEIFKATVSADGTITNAKAVARADLNGNGQTNQNDAPSNAAGLSLLAGLITPEELASGHIDHALAFSVPGIKAGPAIFPAWSNVYVSGPNTVLSEGSKIQLDPSVDISGLPEPQKTIARALQQYGAYLRDNGGTFAIYGETSNRWPAAYGTGLGLKQIPWDKIRVIN